MSDTIIKKANKTENFTIVSNEVPKRNDLSARAKGLYFYLMTLPKDWSIHKSEIYGHFVEGRDALDNAFSELMESGYITQEVTKEKGRFVSFTYTIYEESINGKPVTGNPETVLPKTENPQLLSTDSLQSTNQPITNNKTSKRKPRQIAYSQEFLNFWEIYPKKESKGSAFISFNELLRSGVSVDIIKERLKTYNARIQALKTGYEYIRNPSTFLNNIDDYENGYIPQPKPSYQKPELKVNQRTTMLDLEE